MEVTCGLNKDESRKNNEQKDEKESVFDQKIDFQSQNVCIGW